VGQLLLGYYIFLSCKVDVGQISWCFDLRTLFLFLGQYYYYIG
jgi:hypothetical protein